jgi:hypothetical protein
LSQKKAEDKARKNKEKMKEKEREKGRALWTFYPLIHLTQLGEAVLPNVFLKRLHLHQRSRSTRGARAGAVLGGAVALPNRPFVILSGTHLGHARKTDTQGFFTGGNRAVYRGYCWGTVMVPSGSNRWKNSNSNLNSKNEKINKNLQKIVHDL